MWFATATVTGEHNNDENEAIPAQAASNAISGAEVSAPDFFVAAYPNPFAGNSNIKYRVTKPSNVTITVYEATGKQVSVLVNRKQDAGIYTIQWNAGSAAKGIYFVNAVINGSLKQSVRLSKQ